MRKIELEKIKLSFKKLPKLLGEKFFLTFLILLFLALILAGLIFYKYAILVQKEKIEIGEKILKFDEKTYQKILKIWQERERKFQESDLKTYPDPFR